MALPRSAHRLACALVPSLQPRTLSAVVRGHAWRHYASNPAPKTDIVPDNVFVARKQGGGSIANAFRLDLVGAQPKGSFETFKAFFRFYRDGVKQIFQNYRTATDLNRKPKNQWTRAEFQLVHRAANDKRRVYPFVALALVLPEAIPFVLVFAPAMVPSTCVKPEQETTRRMKIYAVRTKTAKAMHDISQILNVMDPKGFSDEKEIIQFAQNFREDFNLEALDEAQLSAYCKFLGQAGWGPINMLRNRLKVHLEYIRQEDKYLAAEGISSLSVPELEIACENRGISTFKSTPVELRQQLDKWTRLSTMEPSVPSAVLVFVQIFGHDTK